MTTRLVRFLVGSLVAGTMTLVAAAALAAPEIIVCYPLPVASAPAPVTPSAVPPVVAERWSVARWLGEPVADAPVEESAGSPVASPLNVKCEPLRFIGYLAPGLVLDPLRDRLVLYGGLDAYGRMTDDVWTRPLTDGATWTRLAVPAPLPDGRSAHAAIYDARRDRLVVYGGYCADSCGAVWALSFSGTPTWSCLTPADTGPGQRTGARAVYDPVGDRMIVFGGYSYETKSLTNDVWALSLSGTPAWTKLQPAGTPPRARTEGAVVYDAHRQRLVLFGGSDSSDPYDIACGDVWTLSLGDSLVWTELRPAGDPPPARYACATAYDPVADRMIVFGGLDSLYYGGAVHSETWALQFGDSPTWMPVTTPASSPSGRASARAVYDEARQRFVMYGGDNSDLWTLPSQGPAAWTRLEAGERSAPYPTFLQAAAFDSARSRMLVSGGEYTYVIHSDHYYYAVNNLFALSLSPRPRWEAIERDSAPAARYGHSIIVDPVGDRLVAYGGAPGAYAPFPDQLWQLPFAEGRPWSQLLADSTPPSARYLHSAVYDPTRRRMVIFGGYDGLAALADTWVLWLGGTPRWERLAVAGVPPAARWGAGAAYDVAGDRMIVFGGSDGSRLYGDTWQLRFAGTPTWSPLTTADAPPARCVATLSADPAHRCLVLFSGRGAGAAPLSDTWVLPLADSTNWVAATANGAPGPRWGASLANAVGAGRLLMMAGTAYKCGDSPYRDLWSMTLDVPSAAEITWLGSESPAGGIVLNWRTDAGGGFSAAVQRRTTALDWADLGVVRADSDGRLRYEDRTAVHGARYAYRITWRDAWDVRSTPEVWAELPSLPFLLAGATPNPSSSGLRVSFRLPDDAPARLELVDVSGRRLSYREVGGLGPGPHVVDLDPDGRLRPAIYLVRLTRGSRSQTARVCVVR